jgi:hypothetical protein
LLLGLAVGGAVFIAVAGLLSSAALPLFWPDEEPGTAWLVTIWSAAGIVALYSGWRVGRDSFDRRMG